METTMTRTAIHTQHFVVPTGQTFSDYVRANRIVLRGLFLDYVTVARRIDPEKMRDTDEWDRLWHGFSTTVRFGFNLFCKGRINEEREPFHSFCKTLGTDADGRLGQHTWSRWAAMWAMFNQTMGDARDLRATQSDSLI
jgi:hypothetical protein